MKKLLLLSVSCGFFFTLTACSRMLYTGHILTAGIAESFGSHAECEESQFWFNEGYDAGASSYGEDMIYHTPCPSHKVDYPDDYEKQWFTGYAKGTLEKTCHAEVLQKYGQYTVYSRYTPVPFVREENVLSKIEKHCPTDQLNNLKIAFYLGKIARNNDVIKRSYADIETVKSMSEEQKQTTHHYSISTHEETIKTYQQDTVEVNEIIKHLESL